MGASWVMLGVRVVCGSKGGEQRGDLASRGYREFPRGQYERTRERMLQVSSRRAAAAPFDSRMQRQCAKTFWIWAMPKQDRATFRVHSRGSSIRGATHCESDTYPGLAMA